MGTENARKTPLFERLCLVGCGLIGSSIAHAARRGGVAAEITVADRDPAAIEVVKRLGFADLATTDAAAAAAGADLVIIATPVGAAGAAAAAIAPALKDGAILSDVGSVKAAVIEAVTPHLPTDARRVDFVPAHPIAGTEQSGPAAGFAELFDGRWCLITPTEAARPEAVAQLAAFWRALGSEVETMAPERHDRVLAITSHLPHLIAFTIVGTASDLEVVDQAEVIKYSAGGFRDFTRIAASDPTMWRDVFLTNKEAVLELLARFSEDLALLQRAIRWGDGATLFEHFSRTQAIRKGVISMGQDVAAPDFGRQAARPPASGAEPEGERRSDEAV